jgi:hypothetical protein
MKVSNKQKGSILVEFALIIPILLTLTFGIIDLVRMNIAYGYLSTAARTTADIIAQTKYVDFRTYKKFTNIMKGIMSPLPYLNTGIHYQSFAVSKSGAISIIWTHKEGSLRANPSGASPLVKKIKEKEQGIISVKIQADYQPILSFIFSTVTLEDEAYSKVRNGKTVCYKLPKKLVCG